MTENWSISRLNEETALDRRTIKKILAETAPCDANEKTDFYKLADFIQALIAYHKDQSGASTLEREQARLTSAKADIAEVDRARIRNEVVEVETVFRVIENIFVSIRRTILTCPLPQEQKDAILNELRSLKIEDLVEQREFDQGPAAESG